MAAIIKSGFFKTYDITIIYIIVFEIIIKTIIIGIFVVILKRLIY